MMKISLIVTTYNRPDALDKVLDSVSKLRFIPEVVIADDGSGRETKNIVDKWKKTLPIIHAWQEDRGFRAASARNLAVAKSTGDYLIFIDGDCLVLPNFIGKHIELSEKGFMVAGNRILFAELLTKKILADKVRPLEWGVFEWVFARVTNEVNRLVPLINLPNGVFRKIRKAKWQGIRTCNLGMFKNDFLSVSGFDGSFQGWGHEDADLAIRLIKNGIQRKDGQFGTAVLHLWHKENDRSHESANKKKALLGIGE